MGNYLQINNREINSKTLSKILIDAIRDLDFQVMSNEDRTKKAKKYFVPEYYKKTESGEIGCGDWTINKKGMALLVMYLKIMREDDDAVLAYVIKSNEHFSEMSSKEITELIRSAKKDILWCYDYTTSILTDMVLCGMKKVVARWV